MSIAEQRAAEAAEVQKNAPQHVKLVAIDVPIGDLMVFYFRSIVAAIPVAFVLAVVVFLARLLWSAINP